MGRRRKGEDIHGWAVVDKPFGLTSTETVNRIRRALNARKAGHGGTLDPLATGILAVALGEATKTIPYVMDAEKTYRFTARWGEERATDDREGEVTATSGHRPSREDIEAVLPRFVGEISQIPPDFSAIKVGGERAYDLARAGETVELEPRMVHVHELRLLSAPDSNHATFEMRCGKGTYVRSLVRDLARALGTCGHVHEIRRTRVGVFGETQAIPLDKWMELGHSAAAKDELLPVETALDDIPALAVTGNDATRLRNGQSILLRDEAVLGRVKAAHPGGTSDAVVLCSLKGRPVALCRFDRGALKPTRVFNIPL